MILSDSETLENNNGSIIPEKNIRHCLNIHEKNVVWTFQTTSSNATFQGYAIKKMILSDFLKHSRVISVRPRKRQALL